MLVDDEKLKDMLKNLVYPPSKYVRLCQFFFKSVALERTVVEYGFALKCPLLYALQMAIKQ